MPPTGTRPLGIVERSRVPGRPWALAAPAQSRSNREGSAGSAAAKSDSRRTLPGAFAATTSRGRSLSLRLRITRRTRSTEAGTRSRLRAATAAGGTSLPSSSSMRARSERQTWSASPRANGATPRPVARQLQARHRRSQHRRRQVRSRAGPAQLLDPAPVTRRVSREPFTDRHQVRDLGIRAPPGYQRPAARAKSGQVVLGCAGKCLIAWPLGHTSSRQDDATLTIASPYCLITASQSPRKSAG